MENNEIDHQCLEFDSLKCLQLPCKEENYDTSSSMLVVTGSSKCLTPSSTDVCHFECHSSDVKFNKNRPQIVSESELEAMAYPIQVQDDASQHSVRLETTISGSASLADMYKKYKIKICKICEYKIEESYEYDYESELVIGIDVHYYCSTTEHQRKIKECYHIIHGYLNLNNLTAVTSKCEDCNLPFSVPESSMDSSAKLIINGEECS